MPTHSPARLPKSPMRPDSVALRKLITWAAVPVALSSLGALVGCSGGPAINGAATPTGPGSSTPTAATSSPATGSHPRFLSTNYTFTLTVSCYCPAVGRPVRVRVKDSLVASAEFVRTGEPAYGSDTVPDFLRITLNDLIDLATRPAPVNGTLTATWPQDSPWPHAVDLDRDTRALDDEISYTVNDVRISDY